MLSDVEKLHPEFNGSAAGSLLAHRRERASESAAESGRAGLLTLERRERPFETALMRIDWLLGTGLKEDRRTAYEMMRHVWQDMPFGHETEAELLQKLDDTADLMAEEKKRDVKVPTLFLPIPMTIKAFS